MVVKVCVNTQRCQVTGLWLDYYIRTDLGVRPGPGNGLEGLPLSFVVPAECLKVVSSSLSFISDYTHKTFRKLASLACIPTIRCRTTSTILITNNTVLKSHLFSLTIIPAVPLLHRQTTNSLPTTITFTTTNPMVPTSSAALFNFPPANLPDKPFVWNCRRYKRLIWVESQYDNVPLALVFAFFFIRVKPLMVPIRYARVDRRPLDPPPVVLLRMFHVDHPGSSREIERELKYESVVLRASCFRNLRLL